MKVNPNQSKYDYLLECNQGHMDEVSLSFEDKRITNEEMFESIDRYAKMLRAKGVREGDIIGICAQNNPESVYLLYALNKLGAIVVGYSPFDKKERVKADVELTRPKMIITTDFSYGGFKKLEKSLNFSSILYSSYDKKTDPKLKLGMNAIKIATGGLSLSRKNRLNYILRQNFDNVLLPEVKRDPSELSDILFTGGSSGIHKGVDLSDNGLNYVVEGMNSIFPAERGMIHLGNIPFGHMAYGRSILHFALCNGMEFALTLKAMPSDFYSEIERTGATAAVGGPPHWVTFIEKDGDQFVPSRKLKPGSLKNLHYATSGGEAKKANTVDGINRALAFCGSDAVLGDGLGATETWASIMINNGKIHSKDTVGVPLSTVEIKLIDDETKEEVKQGSDGLLYVSGPTVMLGYHNNPEETAKVTHYDEDGKKWIDLGDILRQEENREYKYIGRKKRNFVSGCDNIYPEELEDLLIQIPEIREVVVTPISDEMVQYIPRYHISLYKPNTNRKKLEEKITALVLSKLNENWLPGSIVYYDKPLERMLNSKVNIPYYLEQDKIALEKGEIDHKKAKELRLKKI